MFRWGSLAAKLGGDHVDEQRGQVVVPWFWRSGVWLWARAVVAEGRWGGGRRAVLGGV
jgi:hypothetical protein